MRALRSLGIMALTALATFSLACSSSSTPARDVTADAGADAALSTVEATVFNNGGSSVTLNQQVSVLADELFDFDPTINPAGTADQNAAAIGANVMASLGTCGSVKVTGADVTVGFGAPPGCTLPDGTVISGTVDVAVTDAGGTATIALTLDDVVVNGASMAGTASFSTTNGTMFTVTTNLMSGTKTDVASLTITAGKSSFSVTGTATDTEAGVTTKLVLTGLTVTYGECYATAGTVEVTEGAISESYTFNAETPETGQVTLTIGKRSSTKTLPAYGSCPSAGSSPRDAGAHR
jgi:hypothetical protein